MRQPILSLLLFSASVLLAVTHLAGLTFGLYYLYPWLDIVVHALGGIVVAFGMFVGATFLPRIQLHLRFVPVLVFVFFVGVLWEIYEIAIGIPYYEHGFFADMILDLIMDTFGGSIGYFVAKRLKTLT